MSVYTVPLMFGALALALLFLRARRAGVLAPGGPRRTLKKRFSTGKLLIGAAIAWLLIGFQLQHLNHEISGDPADPPSAWEQIVNFVSRLF